MDNLTTAARAGRLAGIAARETVKAVRMVDWEEVGAIVVHGLVIAVVGTYCLGLWTGRAVHGCSEWLAERWPTKPRMPRLHKAPAVVHRRLPVRTLEPVLQARWLKARGMSQRAISRQLGIPRTTLRRMLAA